MASSCWISTAGSRPTIAPSAPESDTSTSRPGRSSSRAAGPRRGGHHG
jgi:hypothetical protein